MKLAAFGLVFMAALAAGCGDIKLVPEADKMVDAPADASRAEGLIASTYQIPASEMSYLEVYWYGGAALNCNDGGFIARDGHTCVGGEHLDGVIIVARDDRSSLSGTGYLAHEMLHFKLGLDGDPDETHSRPEWGTTWNHPRGLLDVANDALAAAGM